MNPIKNVWAYRIAAIYFVIFTIQNIAGNILSAIAGKDLSTLTGQQKLQIALGIIVTVTGTLLAFLSQQAKRIEGANPESELSTPPKP